MPERLCRVCDKWHDLDEPWPAPCCKPMPAISDLPFPQVMSDTMDPVQSMVTGVYHTSKRAMRAEYKQHNVAEVGNDPARLRPYKRPRKSDAAIRDTVEKAVAKFDRGERASH